MAFSHDGRWLASAGEDTTVRIWDAKSGKPMKKLRGHTGFVVSLIDRDDSRLIEAVAPPLKLVRLPGGG